MRRIPPTKAAVSRRAACGLLLTCALGCRRRQPAVRALRIAAAADAEPALRELGAQFEAQTGRSLVWSFGSSGLLSQQVENGAPFDLLAVANEALIRKLMLRGRLVPGSQRRYARGQLVLVARPGQSPPPSLTSLLEPTYRRIAIANPTHAPYGQAALAALGTLEVSTHGGPGQLPVMLQQKLVFGENVRQALQYLTTGNVDAALVARSLAQQQGLPFTVVPSDAYPPLLQTLAVIRGGDEATAAALAAFVCGPVGQATLQRHGFAPSD